MPPPLWRACGRRLIGLVAACGDEIMGFGSNTNGSGLDEEKGNPNVNCLAAKRCPKCGSDGPFEIEVLMRVLLCDDGCHDAEDGSIYYDDDAPAMCHDCRYEGKFGDFNLR